MRLDLSLQESLADDPARRPDLQIAVERAEWTPGAGFTAHHLLDDPYAAVVPRSHRVAGLDEVELAELATEQWVDNDVARGACRAMLVEACTAAGFSPPFHIEAHDYPTAIAFVAAGIGMTVLPVLGTRALPPELCAVPVVRPTPVRTIVAVVRDAAADVPPVRTALEVLRAVSADAHRGPDLDARAPSWPPVHAAVDHRGR